VSAHCDYLVIGSGLAGLAFALKVADQAHVIILSKTKLSGTNTSMAQGGIAAVWSKEDSFESHIKDTLIAGAGLCHEDTVRYVVNTAPDRINDLISWGVKFDTENGLIDLTREGGHSHRRILHVQDHTGNEIHNQLLLRVCSHPNIEVRENVFGVDLITNREFNPFSTEPLRCLGAHVFNSETGISTDIFSRITMLATGGAGKVYLYTSNWSGATGDGIAMAYRAGARVANLEFMQFHPTCLYHPGARNFLITEAIRGEGGILLNSAKTAFAKKYHPLGELAPRDIVARSIDAEMKESGAECVYLDISHKSRDFLTERFPVILKTCAQFGIDITREPIPVVPAAHYLCGGVIADQKGRTDIAGLLVAGETACSGLHGANRLASNSLLECLVFAHSAAQWAGEHLEDFSAPQMRTTDWSNQMQRSEDEKIVISHSWEEIRRLMWNYVGIVRSNRRLERARSRLSTIMTELKEYSDLKTRSTDILELRNLALVASLTVNCALRRQESRGIHFNIDYPNLAKEARDSIPELELPI
jgi:L-aspartate oxidase